MHNSLFTVSEDGRAKDYFPIAAVRYAIAILDDRL